MLGTSWFSKCEVLLFPTAMTSEQYPGPSESDALLSKYLEYFLPKIPVFFVLGIQIQQTGYYRNQHKAFHFRR